MGVLRGICVVCVVFVVYVGSSCDCMILFCMDGMYVVYLVCFCVLHLCGECDVRVWCVGGL